MAEHSNTNELRQVKSCGFLVMKPDKSFLLMKHAHRYDLPKGHMEIGETEHSTALRELLEETGIKPTDVDIDPNFRFEGTYYPKYRRFGNERVQKTVVIFLARLTTDSVHVIPTEHRNFQWFNWSSPPAPIQSNTIDPLLKKVHEYLLG